MYKSWTFAVSLWQEVIFRKPVLLHFLGQIVTAGDISNIIYNFYHWASFTWLHFDYILMFTHLRYKGRINNLLDKKTNKNLKKPIKKSKKKTQKNPKITSCIEMSMSFSRIIKKDYPQKRWYKIKEVLNEISLLSILPLPKYSFTYLISS